MFSGFFFKVVTPLRADRFPDTLHLNLEYSLKPIRIRLIFETNLINEINHFF